MRGLRLLIWIYYPDKSRNLEGRSYVEIYRRKNYNEGIQCVVFFIVSCDLVHPNFLANHMCCNSGQKKKYSTSGFSSRQWGMKGLIGDTSEWKEYSLFLDETDKLRLSIGGGSGKGFVFDCSQFVVSLFLRNFRIYEFENLSSH